MPNLRSKRAALVAAGLIAVLGGGGAAVAATSTSSSSSFLDSVAKHLGVSREKLEDATKAAAIDQVEADLAAGRITKEQADALKERIQSGDGPWLRGPGFGGHHRGGPGGPGGRGILGDKLGAAASYLGLTNEQLVTRLRDGKSLADVAKERSKSVDGLKDAIVNGAEKALDEAVKAKRLTDAQRKEILEHLNERIDALVNGELRFHHRGPGPDGPAGP